MSYRATDSIGDETYIFLDCEGKASNKYDLYIHWNLYPQREVLITCKSSDSLAFLRSLMIEGLHKIEALSGLNNLQVVNLCRLGKPLPQTGIVRKFIKSSDVLTCDVISSELWLNLRFINTDLKIAVSCQMKTALNLTIDALLIPFTAFARDSGVMNESQELNITRPRNIDLNSKVGDIFNFIHRKIFLNVEVSSDEHTHFIPSEVEESVLERHSDRPKTLPVRKVQVSQLENSVHDTNPISKTKRCLCLLF